MIAYVQHNAGSHCGLRNVHIRRPLHDDRDGFPGALRHDWGVGRGDRARRDAGLTFVYGADRHT